MAALSFEQGMKILSSILPMIGALLGVWVANKSADRQLRTRLDHDREKDIRRTRREKLEGLYLSTKELIDFFMRKHYAARLTIDKQLPREVYLSLMPSGPAPLPQMKVVVDLYFHDIFSSFQPIAKAAQAINRILIDLEARLATTSRNELERISKELDEWYDQAIRQIRAFEQAIFCASDPELRGKGSA